MDPQLPTAGAGEGTLARPIGIRAIEGRPTKGLLALGGLALLVDGAAWLYVALRLPVLPQVLPIHYSASGQVDRIGFRDQLFILPVIGLLTLIANVVLSALLRHDRQLPYVLIGVAVLVQLLIVGALVQLIH